MNDKYTGNPKTLVHVKRKRENILKISLKYRMKLKIHHKHSNFTKKKLVFC